MKKMKFASKWLALAVLAAGTSSGFAVADLYRNTTTSLGYGYEVLPGKQIGDEVVFDAFNYGNLGNWALKNFSFQYHVYNVTAGVTNYSLASSDPRITVSLYANNSGNFGSSTGLERPGSLLWSGTTPSGFLVGTNGDTAWMGVSYGDWAYGSIVLPTDKLTWTVQLAGTWDPNDHFGLAAYGPGTVGQNYDSFWDNTGGVWQTMTDTNAVSWAFGASVDAVPEPSTVWLLGLGGLFSLSFIHRWLRRK